MEGKTPQPATNGEATAVAESEQSPKREQTVQFDVQSSMGVQKNGTILSMETVGYCIPYRRWSRKVTGGACGS